LCALLKFIDISTFQARLRFPVESPPFLETLFRSRRSRFSVTLSEGQQTNSEDFLPGFNEGSNTGQRTG
jgi:hypothetical protein